MRSPPVEGSTEGNLRVTSRVVAVVLHYQDETGGKPFAVWFDGLDAQAARKVQAAIEQMAAGNRSEVRSVGGGVLERRIHSGPGYRVYFGRDGDRMVILLAGGTKQRQSADIVAAKSRWADYLRRTRGEGS